MLNESIAGSCGKCGAPYSYPSMWMGILPPQPIPSCMCWNVEKTVTVTDCVISTEVKSAEVISLEYRLATKERQIAVLREACKLLDNGSETSTEYDGKRIDYCFYCGEEESHREDCSYKEAQQALSEFDKMEKQLTEAK